MIFGYLGNHLPSHSTETHVARALEYNGHTVRRYQENDLTAWGAAIGAIRGGHLDVMLWTRTGWDPPVPHDLQRAMLTEAVDGEVPTVGYHLDRWWGLDREGQVREEPFFKVDLLITADGGHDEQWKAAGVNHHWMPPGVSLAECEPGTFRPELASDIAFVGSWRAGYHPEWTHRPALVKHLMRHWRKQVRFWPEPGAPAVRGQDLRDLYASTKVLVGDSCMVEPSRAYYSDRIPETVGRGGFLLHPDTPGLDEHFTDGEHLVTWQLGDWDDLDAAIGYYLSHDDERRAIASAGKAHVMEHHTYETRMRQLVELLEERGMV